VSYLHFCINGTQSVSLLWRKKTSRNRLKEVNIDSFKKKEKQLIKVDIIYINLI